jgi:hypothetical protein
VNLSSSQTLRGRLVQGSTSAASQDSAHQAERPCELLFGAESGDRIQTGGASCGDERRRERER